MPNRIEHVGFVVDDLPTAQAFLRDVLEFDLDREMDLSHRGVQVAFYQTGSIQIELLEAITPEGRAKRLGPPGTKGKIEHIAIIVDSLAETLEKRAGHGVRWTPVDPPYVVSVRRHWVMTDPETTGGIMYQFIELDE